MNSLKAAASTLSPAVSPAASRIMALDLLRGYFIIIIASIHLSYYPSLFGVFDGRGILYMSEADGFFFISGLLIGIIRQRDLVKNGFKSAAKHLLKRGWILYVASVILTFLYYGVALFTDKSGLSGAKDGLADSSLWQVVQHTLTFRYSYGWTDFLVYYAAFMGIGPLVIWLLSKGKWWLVLLISYGLYFLHWKNIAPTAFFQWQAPFFIGAVVGYHWDTIIERYRSMSVTRKALIRRTSISSTILIYIFGILFVLIPSLFPNAPSFLRAVYSNNLHNAYLLDLRSGLLRPFVLVIIMMGLLFIVRKYEQLLLRTIGKFILPFGQNSLYVYIVESIVLFAVPYFILQGNFFRNSLVELGIIFLVWLALRHRFLFKIIPR